MFKKNPFIFVQKTISDELSDFEQEPEYADWEN